MLNKVIISGGGTGGHIFPAVAIADEITRRNPQCEILFVGALGKMEMEKVPQAGYKIEGLKISGFNRANLFKNITLPFKLIGALLKASSILKKFKPDVVVGVGGYASSAVLFVASSKGLPCLIQEQNSFAGVTNKFLASKVKKICVAYSGMEKFFPKEKIIWTGNPVRKEIYQTTQIDKASAKTSLGFDSSKPLVFVTGGSLGAGTINRSMESGVEVFMENGINVYWQTGKNFASKREQSSSLKVNTFVQDMASAYAAADLVIARAGALTVSELCLAGKASVLVPSPNVAEDHQTKNALYMEEAGAALLVKDTDADKKLVNKVVQLLGDEETIKKMENCAKEQAKPEAIKHITDQIESLVP